jgi:hypothetical protein
MWYRVASKVLSIAVLPILELTLKYGGKYNKAQRCPHCGKFHK